jgi:hypothetical protein
MGKFSIIIFFAVTAFADKKADKDTKATASVDTDGETMKFATSKRKGDTTHMVIDGEGKLSEDNSAPIVPLKRLTRTEKKHKATPEKESVPPAAAASLNKDKEIVQDDAPRKHKMHPKVPDEDKDLDEDVAPEKESVPPAAAASLNKDKEIVQNDAPRKYKMRTEVSDEDDDLDDVALDELEAITIEGALLRKHFSPPPPVNCKWGAWTKSVDCSQSCGGGMQPWTRNIAVKDSWGGKKCKDVDGGKDNKNTKCDNDVCPTTAAPTPAPTTTPAFASRKSGISFLAISALWLAGQ